MRRRSGPGGKRYVCGRSDVAFILNAVCSSSAAVSLGVRRDDEVAADVAYVRCLKVGKRAWK